MKVTQAVQARVSRKVKECINAAKAHYGRNFDIPTIKYNVRGTTAGKADCSCNTAMFNSVLLMENQDDFLERTVPHEVAHLIDYVVNPANFESDLIMTRSGRIKRKKRDLHGADFKFIMTQVLGADDGSRCHTYDTTNAAVKRRKAANYIWVCKEDPSIEMELGPKRHQKQLTGITTYRLRGTPKGYTFEYSHRVGEPKPAVLKKETPAEEQKRKLQEGGWALAANVKKKAANATSHNRPTGKQSKLDICREVWDNNPNEDRQGMISKFVGAGCTVKGAATYYSKIKKEKV